MLKIASDPSEIFEVVRQIKHKNLDAVWDKSICNDEGNFCVGNKDKKRAWEQHYKRLCNEEFPWNEDLLHPAPPVQGPPPEISHDLVEMAVKASGPSDIMAETIKAAGVVGVNHLHSLTKKIVTPSDWLKSYILAFLKEKEVPIREETTEGSS